VKWDIPNFLTFKLKLDTNFYIILVAKLIALTKSRVQKLMEFYDQNQDIKSDEMMKIFQKAMIEDATRDFRPKLKSFEID
jgi:hypothetical protein